LLPEAAAAVGGGEDGTDLAGSDLAGSDLAGSDLAAGKPLAALGDAGSAAFSEGFAVAVFLALPSTILK
jgi:hypothetical protein